MLKFLSTICIKVTFVYLVLPIFLSVALVASAEEQSAANVEASVNRQLAERGLLDSTLTDTPLNTPENSSITTNTPTVYAVPNAADDGQIFHNGGSYRGTLNVIALVAVVLTLGGPILAVGLVSYFRYRRLKVLQQCLNRILDEGREIPEDFFHVLIEAPSKRFRSGIKQICLGLGLLCGLSLLLGLALGSIGAIFIFTGLAQLIIWKYESVNINNPVAE